jgi:hypothetical protein
VVHSKNPKATQYAGEGTYRIVQAPLSYTFCHFRALTLILFLFSGDPATRHVASRTKPPPFRPSVVGQYYYVSRFRPNIGVPLKYTEDEGTLTAAFMNSLFFDFSVMVVQIDLCAAPSSTMAKTSQWQAHPQLVQAHCARLWRASRDAPPAASASLAQRAASRRV